METSPRLRNWCNELASAINHKTGETLKVRPKGAGLTFEAAWNDEGSAILSTSIKLPFPAARFARTTSARDFAGTIWPVIGSWADFNLFWLDHQRACKH